MSKEKRDGKAGDKKDKLPIAETCIALAKKFAKLWKTTDNEPYATVRVGDHEEHLHLHGSRFKVWLASQHYEATAKVAGSSAIESTLAVLEAEAGNGPRHKLHKRIAKVGDAIYIDLATEKFEVVQVTASGWDVVDECPVKFKRTGNTAPLPTPVKGGSVEQLRQFTRADDHYWVLLLGWLLDTLKGSGPYLMLSISGEQGSAKTYTCRQFKRLIDPVQKAELATMPRDEQGFGVDCESEHLLGYDNVSGINQTQSDILCRIATGGGLKKRKLYSDSEQVVFDICQPVVLNGIPDLAEANDLLDRMIPVYLERLEERDRKTETELNARFNEVQPAVFGAILDMVSRGLREIGNTMIENLPRMADSVRWVTACFGSTDFLDAYREVALDAVEIGLEASPVAGVLVDCLKHVSPATIGQMGFKQGEFQGSSKELMDRMLDFFRTSDTGMPDKFPDSPKALNNRIRRDSPALRRNGVDVEFGKANGKRFIRLAINPTPSLN